MIKVDTPKGTIIIEDEERQECEIWTRVMGYYRPVSAFNIGKKAEHDERVFFTEEKAKPHLEGTKHDLFHETCPGTDKGASS